VTRLHKILVGALVVQLALAVVVLTRSDAVRIAPMQPVLAGFDSATVTRLQIYDKKGEKPVVDLVKDVSVPAPTGSGALAPVEDKWKLASGFDFPVDATKVGDLLAKLAALKARGPIATNAVRHQQLGVADADFERKLVITTTKGEITLLVGNADQGRTTAVRLANSPKAYGVSGLTAWGVDTTPARWIRPEYLAYGPEQIARLSIATAAGTVELVHGATSWELASLGQPVPLGPGEALDTAQVDRVVNAAGKLTLTNPADPKRDATKPTATVSIWLASDDPAAGGGAPNATVEAAPDHVIDVIAEEGGTTYWVKDRAAATAGIVNKTTYDAVVEVTVDKLLGKTAKPAPAPAPAPKP
jgi:hypothetical protein